MDEPDITEIPIVSTESTGRMQRGVVELTQKEQQIDAAYKAYSQKYFLCFARGLTIASVHGPRVFENCMALFQRDFFNEIAPSLQAVRDGLKPPKQRWWLERTKKASKDADLGLIVVWLTAFPTRPFFGQIGAANRDQAAIVKDRITHLLHWNPWLNEYVELINSQVRSKKTLDNGQPMARFDIISSDIAGAHGGTPDVLIINELSHITKWEFVENLMDNADGVAQGLVIIATNAGHKGTKAEVWRNTAIKSDAWGVHVLAEPAPWHSKATVEEARQRNPFSRWLRLWHGKWTSGKGDALNEEDIDRCFVLPGPTMAPERSKIYLGGLDLGISHDHCGFVSIEVDFEQQKVKLMYMRAWEPQANTGEVDLIDVENACLAMHRLYQFSALYYDPFQAKLMAQRLTRAGVPMREMSFASGTNLTKMATALISLIESKKIDLYDEEGRMRRDLGKFNIVEKSYGLKLEAVSDEFGHSDVGTAFVITLPAAVDLLSGGGLFTADDIIADTAGDDLTEKEKKALPDEFKELDLLEDASRTGHRVRTRLQDDPFAELE